MTSPLPTHLPPFAEYVHVVPATAGLVPTIPQSSSLLEEKYDSTIQKASLTERGGFAEISVMVSDAAARAASRAVLVSFCFRVNALLKSKIPTTNTTSNG